MDLPGWLAARSGRERALVLTGALAVAGWVLMIGVLEPWRQVRAERYAQVHAHTQALAHLEAAAPALAGAAAGSTPRIAPQRLLGHAEQTLVQAGLRDVAPRIEPLAGGGARVHFAGARFDALVGWLETLAATGVTVTPLELRATATPGQVDGSATLTVAPTP